jgi:hypothetical protein
MRKRKQRTGEELTTELLTRGLEATGGRAQDLSDMLSWVRDPEGKLGVPDLGNVTELTRRIQDKFHRLARPEAELNEMTPGKSSTSRTQAVADPEARAAGEGEAKREARYRAKMAQIGQGWEK